MKGKKRKGLLCCLLLSVGFLVTSCLSYFSQANQVATGSGAAKQSSNTPQALEKSRWHSARYSGLEVGKSTRQDMRRVLGKPKSSVIPQARITTNSNTIVAYHYGGPKGVSGNLIVGVERSTGIIAWIEAAPENSDQDDMIKQFGSNYVMTSYRPDDCFIEGQPPYGLLYETSEEPVNLIYGRMEYRQLGVVIHLGAGRQVYRITYISDKWSYGNSASLCSQAQKGIAYIACGCGCCGDVPLKRQCLYRSKADNLQAIVKRDKEAASDSICAQVGCAFMGTKYVYCD